MPKGHTGQTCGEAIRSSIRLDEVVSASELFKRTRKLGDWRAETIWQHLMSLIVNLPPARHHWPSTRPLLFLRSDGQYELYDRRHPKVVE